MHQEWAQRRGRATSQIALIAQPSDLRLILDELYDDLTNLSDTTLPRVLATAKLECRSLAGLNEPLAPLSNPPAVAVASHAWGADAATDPGTKRKDAPSGTEDMRPSKRILMPQIIDLCDSP